MLCRMTKDSALDPSPAMSMHEGQGGQAEPIADADAAPTELAVQEGNLYARS